MKILTLTHEYPPIGGGGGQAAMDIARGLVSLGHEVKVITAHYGELSTRTVDGGVDVYRLHSLRKEAFRAGLPAMGAYVLASTLMGVKIARDWRPDVIHAHFAVPAGAAAYALSLFSGIPYILTIQLGDVPGASPEKTGRWFRWIKPLTPPIWKKASCIAAVSAWVRQMALENYPVPIEVIPNGIPAEWVHTDPPLAHQPPGILFAGRFVEQKNLPVLLDTLEAVRDLSWTATLAGDGQLHAWVEQQLFERGLNERVRLTGWITPGAVVDLCRGSDIYFMPSLTEGLPLTGVMGLSAGLALVLSNAGGNVDLVEHGKNGYLFPPDDVMSFSAALRGLISNPEQLLSCKKRSLEISERFRVEKIICLYEKLLHKAAASPKHS
ncbi:MAG: glycosyltransferase family 4 protein [Anaerolineae bacterium]|nr:glycosyltransferase family 4 protein [Anaerolineae bacterium]